MGRIFTVHAVNGKAGGRFVQNGQNRPMVSLTKKQERHLHIPVVSLALIGLLCIPMAWAADAMEVVLPEITVRNTWSAAVGNPSPQAQVSAEQIREINAINVEDSLRYVPSLFIRKRYPGDTNSISPLAPRAACKVRSRWCMWTACCCRIC